MKNLIENSIVTIAATCMFNLLQYNVMNGLKFVDWLEFWHCC